MTFSYFVFSFWFRFFPVLLRRNYWLPRSPLSSPAPRPGPTPLSGPAPGPADCCLVIIRISAECPLRDNTIHCIPLLPHLQSSLYRTDIFAEASCYLSLATQSRRIICITGIGKDFSPLFQIFKIILRRKDNGHIIYFLEMSGCTTFVKAPILKLYI